MRVLVVDDSEPACAALVDMLESLQFQARSVASAEEAFEAAEAIGRRDRGAAREELGDAVHHVHLGDGDHAEEPHAHHGLLDVGLGDHAARGAEHPLGAGTFGLTSFNPVGLGREDALSLAEEVPGDVVRDTAIHGTPAQVAEQLAEFAAAAVPGCEIEVLNRPSADQRTYKADFSKFARTFPELEFTSPAAGARELADAFVRIGLSQEQYRGRRFVRLRWLEHLLGAGILDRNLRMHNS